jgi:glycine/D-amino acid oxidase-like deaminating enzyme
MRAEVASPTYLGGVWDHTGAGILDPGKLALGLRDAAVRAGVRVFEHSAVHDLRDAGASLEALTASGRVRARRVLLATSAYPPLLRSIARYVVPVYDYVLVSEPLSATRLHAIGWKHRQGIGDGGNQFHYYRLTADNRILYGGWDAVYRYGGPVGPRHDEHDPTFATLAQHFFHTFPQLQGVRFTHRWGGAIDTSSRFSVFFGTAFGGRVSYATGYTGLGVGAARFGGRVALDLLDGRDTEATRLRYVRSKPVPFPPEPLRWAVIQYTRNRLAAADRNDGRRGPWLRLLDHLGLGFDS